MNDFQELVYTRLQSLPNDFVITVGDFGDVTKVEALSHVKDNDEVGKIILEVNRQFFDAIKSGELYACLGQ